GGNGGPGRRRSARRGVGGGRQLGHGLGAAGDGAGDLGAGRHDRGAAAVRPALAVTESDPTLTDLRLLQQLNKAVTLGNLDRHEEALTAAGQARRLADQAGATFRLAQAHCALGQLLFQTGRWDEALAEVGTLPEDLT